MESAWGRAGTLSAMAEAAGFVLAGGRSSRMGREKALLEFEGTTLLERALAVLREVTPEVTIVGAGEKFGAYGPTVEDVYAERGPLGGIHAALKASRAEWNVVLAVDLPFVTAELPRLLLERARESGAVVTVPRIGGGYQPLCAVYRREFAEIAQEALEQGENKIDRLFAAEKTRVVEEDELARFAFTAPMFDNLNTPEEYERARRNSRS